MQIKSEGDKEYKEFHTSLVIDSKYEMIGIRLPLMRKIAKEIRRKFKLENEIYFPIVEMLDVFCELYPDFTYEIVEKKDLSKFTYSSIFE